METRGRRTELDSGMEKQTGGSEDKREERNNILTTILFCFLKDGKMMNTVSSKLLIIHVSLLPLQEKKTIKMFLSLLLQGSSDASLIRASILYTTGVSHYTGDAQNVIAIAIDIFFQPYGKSACKTSALPLDSFQNCFKNYYDKLT